jgi:hypothetical protein
VLPGSVCTCTSPQATQSAGHFAHVHSLPVASTVLRTGIKRGKGQKPTRGGVRHDSDALRLAVLDQLILCEIRVHPGRARGVSVTEMVSQLLLLYVRPTHSTWLTAGTIFAVCRSFSRLTYHGQSALCEYTDRKHTFELRSCSRRWPWPCQRPRPAPSRPRYH